MNKMEDFFHLIIVVNNACITQKEKDMKKLHDLNNKICGTCYKFHNELTPATHARSQGANKNALYYCNKHYTEKLEKVKLLRKGIKVKNVKKHWNNVRIDYKNRKDKNCDLIVNALIETVIAPKDPIFAQWLNNFPIREEKGRWIVIWLLKCSNIEAINEFPVAFVNKAKKDNRLTAICADIGVPQLNLFIECKRNITTCPKKDVLNEQIKDLQKGVKNNFKNAIITAYSIDGTGPAQKSIKKFFIQLKEIVNNRKNKKTKIVKFNKLVDELILVCNTLDFYFTDTRKIIAGKL